MVLWHLQRGANWFKISWSGEIILTFLKKLRNAKTVYYQRDSILICFKTAYDLFLEQQFNSQFLQGDDKSGSEKWVWLYINKNV